MAAIGYAAIALIAGNVAVHRLEGSGAPLRMPGRWRGIEQLRNAHFGEITLKIEHDPNGLLAAMTRYFLPDRKVHVIAPRVRVRDLPFETVSRQSPILIQNFGCEGVGPRRCDDDPGSVASCSRHRPSSSTSRTHSIARSSFWVLMA